MGPKTTREPRRDTIYLHRSFRHLAFNPVAILAAVLFATLLSLAIFVEGQALLDLHQSLVTWFVDAAGLTGGGEAVRTHVFPGRFTALAPAVTVPASNAVPDALRVPALLAAVALLLLSKRNTITRGFFYFLLILLVAGMVTLTLFPHIHVNAESVTQIWLRSALPIWMLMPWLGSFLFIAVNPGWRLGMFWTLGLVLHLFWTSALRQAFLLAAMHYTGILFFPLVWFVTGLLADVVILLVVYSLTLHQATAGLWGRRAEAIA